MESDSNTSNDDYIRMKKKQIYKNEKKEECSAFQMWIRDLYVLFVLKENDNNNNNNNNIKQKQKKFIDQTLTYFGNIKKDIDRQFFLFQLQNKIKNIILLDSNNNNREQFNGDNNNNAAQYDLPFLFVLEAWKLFLEIKNNHNHLNNYLKNGDMISFEDCLEHARKKILYVWELKLQYNSLQDKINEQKKLITNKHNEYEKEKNEFMERQNQEKDIFLKKQQEEKEIWEKNQHQKMEEDQELSNLKNDLEKVSEEEKKSYTDMMFSLH